MHHDIDEAAPLVDFLELVEPDFQHMAVVHDRPRIADREQRIGGVIDRPVPRNLDRAGFAVRQFMAIGHDAVHQGRVVNKALFVQQADHVGAGFAAG
jgi:hypothetical protein